MPCPGCGEPPVLTEPQQRALSSLPSFSDSGQVLVASWDVLSSAGAFVEQPVSPSISLSALRSTQGSSFLV